MLSQWIMNRKAFKSPAPDHLNLLRSPWSFFFTAVIPHALTLIASTAIKKRQSTQLDWGQCWEILNCQGNCHSLFPPLLRPKAAFDAIDVVPYITSLLSIYIEVNDSACHQCISKRIFNIIVFIIMKFCWYFFLLVPEITSFGQYISFSHILRPHAMLVFVFICLFAWVFSWIFSM